MIKKLSSRIVYENKWMKVREDDVEFADGTKGIYGVIDKPDGALIIPRLKENEYVLVKVYRYTTEKSQWEFPCGATEGVKSTPEETAHTELREETGYTAKRMTHLASPYVSYGFTTQIMHMYLAENITSGQHDREAGEIGMEVRVFSKEEIEQMMLRGDITDTHSIAAWGIMKMRGV